MIYSVTSKFEMKTSRVVILVALYNGSDYIESQLKSIQSQTYKNFKVFIRDDGSTDDSIKIVEDFCKEDDRFVLLENDGIETGAPAGNFYKLIERIDILADDYVCFCDQDDIWDPIKVAVAITKINENNCDAYSSNLLAFNNDQKKAWYIKKSLPQTNVDYIFQGGSAGCTYMLRGKLMNHIKNILSAVDFNLIRNISHDWILYAVARSDSFKWFMDDAAYIYYRQHANNSYGDLGYVGNLIRKYKLLRSGWYRNNLQVILHLIKNGEDSLLIKKALDHNTIISRITLAKYMLVARRIRSESVIFILLLIFGVL